MGSESLESLDVLGRGEVLGDGLAALLALSSQGVAGVLELLNHVRSQAGLRELLDGRRRRRRRVRHGSLKKKTRPSER